MAFPKWTLVTEEDPWILSAFICATTELLLSILILLGLAISFLTSRFIKLVGLESPSTYVGYSHPLHFQEGLCIRCGDDHPSYVSDRSPCMAHIHPCQDRHCSFADNSPCTQRNQGKRPWHQGTSNAHSYSTMREGYPALLWAGSSISKSAAEDHCDIFEVPSGYEQQGDCEETHDKGQDHVNSSSSSSFHKRRGRSKRARRRDFVCVLSNKKRIKTYPTLLSTASNPQTKVGNNVDSHGMKCGDEAKSYRISAHHLDEGHAVVKDAIKGESLADLSNEDINAALKSGTHVGFIKENQYNVVQISAKSEQERESQRKILSECFSARGSALTVEDANHLHFSKREETQGKESLLECCSNTGMTADAGNTEQSSKVLSAYGDNQYVIQFGSIVARTCIKDPITNIANSTTDKSFSANVIRIGRGSLQDLGCCESWTERKLSQSCSAVIIDDPASGRTSNDSMETIDITLCTVESFSEECFEGITTPTQNRRQSRSQSENHEDKEEAVSQENQEDLDELKLALQAERLMLAALEVELENERNAAAVATNEAMAMIARLHEEKSAMQMEVTQLQRVSEERAEYDEQAIAVLKEILVRREAENMALEKEIELCRERLFAGNAGEPRGPILNKLGSPTLQSHHNFLQITGQGIGYQSSLEHKDTGREISWTTQIAPNSALEELATSAGQASNKRLRGTHASISGLPFEQSDDMKGGLDGLHETHKKVTKIGKCLLFSDDESLTPEGEFVSAKSFHEHPGCGQTESRKPLIASGGEDQPMTTELDVKRTTSRFTESCGAHVKCAMRIKGGGQGDGGHGMFVPVHDVYEVHPGSDRGPSTEIRELLKVVDGESTDRALQQSISGNTTETQSSLRLTTKPGTVSEETPRLRACPVQETDWEIEMPFYAEKHHECHDLPALSMVSKEIREAEMEKIKQFEARLKALEEDRELMRGTAESFKHRNEELSMLQDISKHLQELRFISLAGVSTGSLLEETCVSSPSRVRPLKKRRFCGGLGRAHASLYHQRSV